MKKDTFFLVSLFFAAMMCLVCLKVSAAVARERIIYIQIKGDTLPATPSRVTVRDLEQLPLMEYATLNPYEKVRITYQGVLLKDLVKHYARRGVNTIRLTATDGYETVFTSEEWEQWDILLATRANGRHMGVKESGPVKIIMPYDTAKDINHTIYDMKWIWMVNTITFSAE